MVNLSESEIAVRLRALSEWRYQDGYLQRHYATHGWKATLMAVNAIGHIAEIAWHHPDLAVSFGGVTVKLMTHDTQGITAKDFELAVEIEKFLMWQPDVNATLTGLPKDVRFGYFKSPH